MMKFQHKYFVFIAIVVILQIKQSYQACDISCDTCGVGDVCGCTTPGEYLNGTICSLCVSPCATCSGTDTTCQSCLDTFFKETGSSSCVTTGGCQSDEFEVGSPTNECQACDLKCTVCSGSSTNCSACDVGFYLDGSTCDATCPGNKWTNGGTNTCDSCDGSCATCSTSATTCQSCNTGWYLSGTACGTTCPADKWTNGSTNTCDSCDASCVTCSTSATTCQSCNNGFYLDGTTCPSTCPSTAWTNSGTNTCDSCDGACSSCSTSATTCQSCNGGWYLDSNSCGTTCPTNKWTNGGTNTCDACDGSCASCSTSATTCQSCNNGWYLDGSTCGTTCPVDKWTNSGSNICDTCDASCINCSTSATTCQSCNNGWFLEGSTCGITCPTIKWENTGTNTCDGCDASCATCSTSSTTCQSCNDGWFHESVSEACVTSGNCPATEFEVGTPTNECQSCDAACSACSGTSTTCSACNNGWYLEGTTCGTTCPTNKWTNGTTNTCDVCDGSCATCSTTATTCQSCNDGWFHENVSETCVTTGNCPTAEFEVGPPSNICESCDVSCATCIGTSTNCQSCNNGWFLDNVTCQTTGNCPIGTWEDSSLNFCTTCDTECASCDTSGSDCQTCSNGWYLNSPNSCLTTCPDSFAPRGPPDNDCLGCHITCTTCNDILSTSCLTCTGSLYLIELTKTCVAASSCPNGRYGDNSDTTNQICKLCDGNCETCVDTSVKCTSCLGNYLDPTTDTCVAVCPDSYVEIIAPDWECQGCDPVCATCYGLLNTECDTCATNHFKLLGTDECVDPCPDGFYGDVATLYCEACHAFCAICYEKLETECTACKAGYYLNPDLTNPNTCQVNCIGVDACTVTPTTIICEPDPVNECVECDSTCLTCFNSQFTGCSTCLADPLDGINDLFLLNTQCVDGTTCPINSFPDVTTATCITCDITCKTCQNFAYECIDCNPNSYLLNNVCIDPIPGCPDRMWPDDTVWECKDCDTTCKTCYPNGTSNDCYDCDPGRYFYFNQCVLECPDKWWEDGSDNTCKQCDTECTLCETAADDCTKCEDGHYLYGNSCDLACPTGTTPTFTELGPPSNLCVTYDCDDTQCRFCQYPQTAVCVECKNGSFLQGDVCVNDCGPGEFEQTSDKSCQPCDPSCVLCDTSYNFCSQCNDGYYWYSPSNVCNTDCPDGWYVEGTPANICTQCNNLCKTCSGGSTTECLSCKNDYYLSVNTCLHLSTCPVGTYGNTDSDLCVDCVSPCDTCTDDGNTGKFCLTCEPGQYLYNNECPTSCIQGWVGNDLTWECEECHTTCLACDGVGYDECTLCSLGSTLGPFLLNKECLNNCPNGYFAHIASSSCVLCDTRCNTCFNEGWEYTCNSCSIGYYFLNNSCLQDCGDKYFSDISNICVACDATCLDCNGTSRYDCVVCELSRIFETDNSCRLCSEYYGMEDDPNIPEDQQIVCREICGDGVTVTETYECDDGNNDDGDGCSADCQIEEGYWKCEGGDESNADICYDYRDIGFFVNYEPTNYYNYEENAMVEFTLSFNKTFNLPQGKYIEDYLSFGFPGINEKFDYQISQIVSSSSIGDDESEEDNNNRRNLQVHNNLPIYKIGLKVSQTVKFRQVTAYITNPEDFTDGFGQGLAYNTYSGEKILKYIFYSDSERSTSDLYSLVIYPASILIVVLATFSYFRYKLHINEFYNVFLCLDLLQAMYFFRFMNIRWPLNLIHFYDNQKNFTNFFIHNFFNTEYEDFDTYKTVFESFNIQEITVLFFNNAGSFFQLFILQFVIFMIVKFLGEKNDQNLKIQPFFNKIYLGYFKFNVILDFTLATGGVFISFGLFQITQFLRAADFILAIILVLIFSFVIMYFFTKLYKTHTNLYVPEDIQQKNNEDMDLQDEDQLEEPIESQLKRQGGTFSFRNIFIHTQYEQNPKKSFITFFILFRQIQLPIALLILEKFQNVMITSQIVVHFAMIAILLKFRIYKTLKNNIRMLLSEIFVCGGLAMCYGLVADEEEDEPWKLNYSWGVLFTFCGVLVVNAIYLFSELIIIPFILHVRNSGKGGVQILSPGQIQTITNFEYLEKNRGKQKITQQSTANLFFGKQNKVRPSMPGLYLSQKELDQIKKKSQLKLTDKQKMESRQQLQVTQLHEEDNSSEISEFAYPKTRNHLQSKVPQIMIENDDTGSNNSDSKMNQIGHQQQQGQPQQNYNLNLPVTQNQNFLDSHNPSPGQKNSHRTQKSLYNLNSDRQSTMQQQVNRARPQSFINNQLQSQFSQRSARRFTTTQNSQRMTTFGADQDTYE